MKLSKEERILLSEVQELDQVDVDLPELYLDFLNTLQERINTNDIAANEISAMMQVHRVVNSLLDQYNDKSVHQV